MNDEPVTTPQPYAEILAANIAAQRKWTRLRQKDLADRMRAQGWTWYAQTVSELEQGKRVIRADEMLGLAVALETTVPALMTPPPVTAATVLPSGELVAASRVTEIGSSTAWDGNRLKITPPSSSASALDTLLAGRREELRRLEALRDELHQAPPPSEGDREDLTRAESHDDHGTGPS